MAGVTDLAGDGWPALRYAGSMRYPDGGGLDAGERARREQVRPGWTSRRGVGGALAAVVIC